MTAAPPPDRSPDGEVAVAWLDEQSGVVEALVGDGPLANRVLELGPIDLEVPASPPPLPGWIPGAG